MWQGPSCQFMSQSEILPILSPYPPQIKQTNEKSQPANKSYHISKWFWIKIFWQLHLLYISLDSVKSWDTLAPVHVLTLFCHPLVELDIAINPICRYLDIICLHQGINKNRVKRTPRLFYNKHIQSQISFQSFSLLWGNHYYFFILENTNFSWIIILTCLLSQSHIHLAFVLYYYLSWVLLSRYLFSHPFFLFPEFFGSSLSSLLAIF